MKTYTIIYKIKLLNIKQAKVFSNSVSNSLRYYITKFENFHSAVCMTPQSQNVRLSKATVPSIHQTLKGFLLIVPLKVTRDQQQNLF